MYVQGVGEKAVSLCSILNVLKSAPKFGSQPTKLSDSVAAGGGHFAPQLAEVVAYFSAQFEHFTP